MSSISQSILDKNLEVEMDVGGGGGFVHGLLKNK